LRATKFNKNFNTYKEKFVEFLFVYTALFCVTHLFPKLKWRTSKKKRSSLKG